MMEWIVSKINKNIGMRIAIRDNDLAKLERMLKEGADPNDRPKNADRYYRTALHRAIDKNSEKMVEMLLKAGADISVPRIGSDVLEYAMMFRTTDVLMPLAKAAPQDMQDKALPLTVCYKYNNVFHYLVDKVSKKALNAALFAATKNELYEYAKVLLEAGADPDKRNKNGHTCRDIATQKGNSGLCELFARKSPLPEKPAKHATDRWELLSPDRIARIMNDPALDRKITDTFNFASRERMIVVENLSLKSETVVLKSFDEMPDKTQIEQAMVELHKRGGTVDSTVIHGTPRNKQPLIPERK